MPVEAEQQRIDWYDAAGMGQASVVILGTMLLWWWCKLARLLCAVTGSLQAAAHRLQFPLIYAVPILELPVSC